MFHNKKLACEITCLYFLSHFLGCLSAKKILEKASLLWNNVVCIVFTDFQDYDYFRMMVELISCFLYTSSVLHADAQICLQGGKHRPEIEILMALT